MDPPDGENPVVRLLGHFSLAPMSVGTTLLFYRLDRAQMTAVTPLLQTHQGEHSCLSWAGTKDIVPQSTGGPMPLLHVQHGPCAQTGLAEPQPGHVHMFCSPAEDPLTRRMYDAGHPPAATASVLTREALG